MITAAFLVCALAMPMSSTEYHILPKSDILFLNLIMKARRGMMPHDDHNNRILSIGGPAYWMPKMNTFHTQAYRVSVYAQTDWDVIASVFQEPFRRDSFAVVIYSLAGSSDWWKAMEVLRETIYGLAPGGYLIFWESKCPLWSKYLVRFGFSRMPLIWRDKVIYQKSA